MTGTIEVDSGVSWLHDTMMDQLQEREQFLLEAMSRGLPYHEYIGFVGRHRECLRQQDNLRDHFTQFYKLDDEEEFENE